MGGLDEIEEILEGEDINYRRVENAIITSFREGEVSYTLIVLSDDETAMIIGRTDPPFVPTEEAVRELLRTNLEMNFASYHLSEGNEVVVTSFMKTRCIKQSFMRNFYAVLSFLMKLGGSYAP